MIRHVQSHITPKQIWQMALHTTAPNNQQKGETKICVPNGSILGGPV